MTRKDYILLADALHPRNTFPSSETAMLQHRIDCEAVADALAKDNPRFDRDRFLKACGVQS